jgi:hypothetical protein
MGISCTETDDDEPSHAGAAGQTAGHAGGGAAGSAGASATAGVAGAAGSGGSTAQGGSTDGGAAGSAGAIAEANARVVYEQNQVFINELRLLPPVDWGSSGAGGAFAGPSNPLNFVELQNDTDEPLSLDACELQKQFLWDQRAGRSAIIPAHGRLLVATDEQCCGGAQVDVLVDELKATPSFPNGTPEVVFYCRLTFGQETFKVWYDRPSVPSTWLANQTWQRCQHSMLPSAFQWSSGSGSPGTANVCN